MAHTKEEYRAMLFRLCPPGQAWPRDPDSHLGRQLGAWAEGLAAVDVRAHDLMREADPSRALELLADYEKDYGIPDECRALTATLAERREAVLSKARYKGGQSPAHLVSLAKAMGHPITIEEFEAFTTESDCDDLLYGDDWAFVFRCNAPAVAVRYFDTESTVDESIASWGNERLECVIRKAKPSHTIALHAYEQEIRSTGTQLMVDGTSTALVIDTGETLTDSVPWGAPITVKDSAGKIIYTGYAKPATEPMAFDSNLLINGDFSNGITGWGTVNGAVIAAVAGGVSGDCLQITIGAGGDWGGAAYQGVDVEPTGLYQSSFYHKSGLDDDVYHQIFNQDWSVVFSKWLDNIPAAWQQCNAGLVNAGTSTRFYYYLGVEDSTPGNDIYSDDVALCKVIQPGPGNLLVFSDPQLTTRGVASVGDGDASDPASIEYPYP
jgi:uncharacterized protein YmfQ (DUF2313 family)